MRAGQAQPTKGLNGVLGFQQSKFRKELRLQPKTNFQGRYFFF